MKWKSWIELGTVVALLTLVCGCAVAPSRIDASRPVVANVATRSVDQKDSNIQQASALEPPVAKMVALVGSLESAPFPNSELTADELVRVVLERNPTIEQMTAIARMAASKYPQVTSLDDPTLGVQTAPFSAGSPNVNFAARVELTQKIPLYGKRTLRGQVALAEASAATKDIGDARLQLAEAARTALADYYLAEKALGVAAYSHNLLREFRQNAETQYKNGLAPQQDILQADVETARLEERVLTFTRAKRVARARINTLCHLPIDGPLPPPADLRMSTPLEPPAELRERALKSRPDLKALSDRLAADATALCLAQREYKPDVELLTAYDGFWQGNGGRPLQWQVGARVNLPIRLGRRDGAVAEAQAKVAVRRAELARLNDQVGLQVQEAYEQCHESMQIVKLFETKTLPAADANVTEAQTAYVNGKVPFLSLVEAQRNLLAIRERYLETRAELFRRRATLDRVVGDAAR